LKDKIYDVFKNIASNYDNEEIFKFYNRGFLGIFNGYRASEQFSEYSSPFLYLDFLNYAIHISPELRFKEKIYLDWILKVSPEAAKYPWEKTGLPINAGRFRVFLRRSIRYAKRKIFRPSPKNSMNPFDYWYKTNNSLRETFEDYYRKHIDLLSRHSELQRDVEKVFSEGTPLEKTQPLTLLAAMKLHRLER